MFQKISIMAQENINHMHNTKERLVSVARKNIVLAHGSATALNGESLGILLVHLYFINIMSSVVVMDHRIFWNTKKIKMPTKVDTDATDSVMGLNDNEQEPGGINKYTDVTDDQEPKHFSQAPL